MNIEAFYQKHKQKLIGYACAFCHDYDLSEDVVQESFLKSLVKCDTFTGRSEPELLSWFYVVIKNRLVDLGRKDWRTQPYYEWMEERSDDAYGMEGAFAFRELIKTLPDTLAAPVWMRYAMGYNSREIGQALGIKDATIRSRLKKAREQLKGHYLKE